MAEHALSADLEVSPADVLARHERGEIALHPDPPPKDGERIHVGSLLPRPDGSLLVFFAKETAQTRAATWGPLVDRTTAIYSETVRP